MSEAKLDPQWCERVKTILRRDLKLGTDATIDDDMPLIGGDFELDSLDMVMLITSVEKEFAIKLSGDTSWRQAFASVRTLTLMLQERGAAGAAASTTAAGVAGTSGGTAATPTIDLEKRLAQLPHRDPFRFVTKLTQIKPGVAGQGQWVVTGQEAFFAGHFPGQPLVPGVLMSEALAQVSGLVGAAEGAAPPVGDQVRLVQVDVRFKQAVRPPATITLASKLAQKAQALEHYDVTATVDGAVVAEGRVVLYRGEA